VSIAICIDPRSERAVAADYFQQVSQLMGAVDLEQVEAAIQTLRQARDSGASIFVIGNGGSAATASHLATDLANAVRRAGQHPVRAFSLADNTACLTALGNDEGYEQVFVSQVDGLVRRGDVLVAISASGNSPNLVRAVELAKARGARTVGLLGFDGGRLRFLADDVVMVPSPTGAYGPVEDVHLMLSHAITTSLCNA